MIKLSMVAQKAAKFCYERGNYEGEIFHIFK